MTKQIYELKQKLLDDLCSEVERRDGLRNMNTNEVGQIVDMIKDLAEAEEKCWKACYYKSVVENMDIATSGNLERMGYNGGGMQGRMQGGRSGYSNMMSGANTGSYGYSDDSMQNVKSMFQSADPAKKQQLMRDMENMMMEFRQTM